jgi:hypothetical protein
MSKARIVAAIVHARVERDCRLGRRRERGLQLRQRQLQRAGDVASRGSDTIGSGGGYDLLDFGNRSTDYINADRVGNDFKIVMFASPCEDESGNAPAPIGGPTGHRAGADGVGSLRHLSGIRHGSARFALAAQRGLLD